ncbi:MAG: pilin [bacterium]|nr:pilin [bacterium]
MIRSWSKIVLGIAVVALGLAAFGPTVNAQPITDIGGYKLIVPLPGIDGESAPGNLAELVRYIYLWLMGIVALAAAIMLLYSGVRYVLASGSPGGEQDAKDQISHALLGFLVVLGSYLILNTINPDLVNFSAINTAPLTQTVPNTFPPEEDAKSEGLCFPTESSPEGLGGRDCGAIGNGWIDNLGGCNGLCSASERCCACIVGEDCDPMNHSCTKKDNEGGTAVSPDDPAVCGPFLVADCMNSCPADFPDCTLGDSCSDPTAQYFTFEIISPLPPTGGGTVTPVTPDQPLRIDVRAPSQVVTVGIKVYNESSAEVYSGVCAPVAGSCGVIWQEGITGPGIHRIVAQGKDASGNAIANMSDTRRVCGDCGPVASFTISVVTGDGTMLCPNGSYLVGSSGAARVKLDGSASTSPIAAKIEGFNWTDKNSVPLYTGIQPAKTVEVLLLTNDTTVTLTVFDQYGAYGSTSKSVSVVETCI